MEIVLEFLFHVILCSVICTLIHLIFHRRVDNKQHHHVDLDKLAEKVYQKIVNEKAKVRPYWRRWNR